jgi:uncharacterized repeat protein (TIGR01451 family)
MKHPCHQLTQSYCVFVITAIFAMFLHTGMFSQCTPSSRTTSGRIFEDTNLNGIFDANESGKSGVLVQAYDSENQLLGSSISGNSGTFSISGLTDGTKVRLVFGDVPPFGHTKKGVHNGTNVQFVQVPSCNISYGVAFLQALCNEDNEIITTCFVQGSALSGHTSEPTIVAIKYGFNSSTNARKFAMHGETGSIWGLAFNRTTKEIFSSAFVKQYSGLRAGHDAIFKSSLNDGMYTTELFKNLRDLGQNVGTLSETDINNCNYGRQVGKIGLGAIVISPDDKYLYVVNIYNNTLVRIDLANPVSGTTESYQIPGEGYHAFALKYHEGKIYAGTTKPGVGAKVFIFDPVLKTFTDSGLNIAVGAAWADTPIINSIPYHWLTDIDFSDNGDMIIALADRVGHSYCNTVSNRLDEQKGDILIAWKKADGWELEDRGTPDKEFFSDDFWVTNPNYHAEISFGGIYAMPGQGSVISAVFDPESNAYSGGLHRYSTTTGKKLGSKELYTRDTEILFGKASGFGEIVSMCAKPDIEIGNLIWFDENNNGIQDANEKGCAEVVVNLYNEKCEPIGSTITDNFGNYFFNNTNIASGLSDGSTYFVGIDYDHYNSETQSYKLDGKYLHLTRNLGTYPIINSDNTLNKECPSGIVKINTSGVSHNFDIGLSPAGSCDLKITKKVLNTKAVKVTDEVHFMIEVHNRGGISISEYSILDILPRGYRFDQSKNTDWSRHNDSLILEKEVRIIPGDTDTSHIVLSFDQTERNIDFTNEGYLLSVIDGDGNVIDNISSCFNEPLDRKDFDAPVICDLSLIHRVAEDRVYTPDTRVVYTSTVCNQGTIDAENFDIVNYVNEELDFDPVENPGWVLSPGKNFIVYKESNIIKPRTCKDFNITFTINEDANPSEIVNYAEISGMKCTGVAADFDFDSTPDILKPNDNGGQPNSPTDNLASDNGIIDEDDHDPATLNVQLIDLSIKKHAILRRVEVGTIINYFLDITNEGQTPVSRVKLKDYLPVYLSLIDNTWTLNGQNAEKVIVIPGNLQPGQSYRATIKCQVNNQAIHPIIIRNRIEIAEMFDQFNRDISHLDYDSTPNNYREKGPNDNEKDIDEDDTSTYDISIICPPEVDYCSARCVAGTNSRNGMRGTFIKFAGIKGDEWKVFQSEGLYDTLSTAGMPISLPEPYILRTQFHTVDYDEYVFDALQIDGQGFSVTFINKFGETETFSSEGGFCQLTKVSLTGPAAVCLGSGSSRYIASLVSTGFISPIFDWIIDANGMSEPSDTLRNRGAILDTLWTTTGTHSVRVFVRGECVSPGELLVRVGNTPTGSMSCATEISLSLDEDCAVLVTPSMISAAPLTIDAAYVVMLIDIHGKVIPNAIVTAEHAGTRVMAKLIEICSGNSCWSWINVEDKVAPVALCKNIELSCFALANFDGPFERDNCGSPVKNILISETVTPVCQDTILKYVDRVYQATDKFGNKSDTCKLRITVLRPNLKAERGILTFPASRTKENSVACDSLILDEKGRPSPHIYGVPKYGPYNIYPVGTDICNIVSWYEDKELKAGCITKIIRTWHVYEQCGSMYQHRTQDQTIEISDKKAPRIEPIANQIITTSGRNCAGDFLMQVPVVTDTCNNPVTIDIIYPGGIIKNIKQPTIIKLSASGLAHPITVKAYDECLNTTQISFTVKVEDNTPPTAICKGQTVAGLNSNGEAYVYADHINDGSYDDCDLSKILVKRMNTANCQPCDAPSIPGFTYVGHYINPGKTAPHHYYVSKHKATPLVAAKTAFAVGGYLVQLNNSDENKWVYDRYREWNIAEDYVVGLRDAIGKGSFTWYNQQPSSFTNWETGFPVDVNITPLNPANDSIYVRAKNNNGKWINFGTDNQEFLYVIEIEDPCGFSESVKFCCTDAINNPHSVVFRAVDTSGNWNECMVDVIVQDKFIPKITCPDDTTIDCSDAYAGMDLSGFGRPTVIDACNPRDSMLPAVFKLNSCRIGTIERTFRAYDGVNSATCTQIITVTNDEKNRFSPKIDVDFPIGIYEVDDKCTLEDLEPDNLPAGYGRPVIRQTSCSMASSTYKDETFTFATGACYKILRTWTVIDWCEMERLGGDYVPAKFIQTIKVNNTIPPFFVGNVSERDTFITEPGNCSNVIVNLQVTGRDLCTPDNQLRKVVKIDLGSDGIFEETITGIGHINRITNKSFPVGTSKVQWSFEDACGNVVTKDQFITVISSGKPVAVALEKISVSVEPWDIDGDGNPDIEKVCIDAASLDASSYSTCCVDKPLVFSFSADKDSTKICFDCRHVGQNNIVQLWVHDCNGRSDFVNVKIDVQDNNNSNICKNLCVENPVTAVITGVNNICQGSSTTLTVSGGIGFEWSNGSTSSSITVSPSVTTVYTVTAIGPFGCSSSTSVTVTVRPTPEVAISGANICMGGSTTITATGGGTYLWNTGSTASVITVSPTSSTTYTVTVTNVNGCSATLSRVVTVSQPPLVNITGNNSVCINQSSTLTATGGGAYLWSTGSTSSALTVTPVANTTYTVTVTDDNGCTASSSFQVSVNGLTINPAISGDIIICVGESTTLSASGGNSYRWSNSATTTSISVSPVANTTFTVTVTDINGCTGIATSNVVVNPIPNVVISGASVFCPGNPVNLTASGATSFVWSTGQTSASITVSPVTATDYRVTGTDSNGCIDTASIRVTVADLSQVSITGNNLICPGDSTILKAIGGVSYVWNNGLTSDSIKVIPNVTSTYTVTVTTQNGCTAVLNRTVTLRTPPTASITGNLSICPGGSTMLTATGGMSFRWSTGATSAVIVVNPASNMNFAVTVTDNNGCTDSVAVSVNILPPPSIQISGDNSICPGDSTILSVTGGNTYIWNTGATSNQITVKPVTTTTYTVTATASNGCTATSSIIVTLNSPPIAVISSPDSICSGASVGLSAAGGINYLWNTGATTSSINLAQTLTTTYSVTVTDINGCTASSSKMVNIFSPPTAVISGDLIICVGESTTLTATGGSSYIWSTLATTNAITVSPTTTTTYTVTVTDAKGCTASTSAVVMVDMGTLICTTRNYTAQLGANGSVTIRPEDVSTGTFGNCPNITARVTPATFFCNDAGNTITVTLIVKNVLTNDSLTCPAQVTVQDTIDPVITCPGNVSINCESFNPNAPLTTYGTATAIDNCLVGINITEGPVIRNLNNCNAGQIIRTFIATDRMGNSSQCVQIVTIGTSSSITPGNIQAPPNITVSKCDGIDTSRTGSLRLNITIPQCSKISISYTDNPPTQNALCAGIITRTWLLVDTCQLVPGTNNGRFSFSQIITVTGQQPTIVGPETINLETSTTNCFGELSGLFHTATGCNLTLSNTRNELASFNIEGEYPIGKTTVTLAATDNCGVTAVRQVVVDVVDKSELIIECRKGFPQISDNLFVDEPASTFYTIQRACNDNRIVLASFDESNPTRGTRRFDCNDVGIEPTPRVTLYFYYQGQTNHFFSCSPLARTQDPNNFCAGLRPVVSGTVKTENEQAVRDVEVKLDGSNGAPIMSNKDGQYNFPDIPTGGEYQVIPSKNTGILEGISTLDLVFIQKHILGMEALKSPYQLIAADVNKDNKVTAADLTLLRKVILGIQDHFGDNKSWRMIDKNYKFADNASPFSSPFPEKYHIGSLDNHMKIDWVGVKIGDVNSSYIANVNDVTSNRSADYNMIVNKALSTGPNKIIPVSAGFDLHITGFQFSAFVGHVENIKINSGLIDMMDFNYSYADGILRMSWHNPEGIRVQINDILFNIEMKKSGINDNTFSLTKLINPEVYSASNGIHTLGLKNVDNSLDKFELIGNTPNPWNQNTEIKFLIPENGDVSIRVRDITGRVIYTAKEFMNKGENSIILHAEQLNGSGILLYDITFGKEVKTMKMLNIR